jgi:hypothetical protein
MQHKMCRVTRRVARLTFHRRTLRNETVKYLPCIYQSIHTGTFDFKSFENATAEMVAFDFAIIGLNISTVLLKDLIKKNRN